MSGTILDGVLFGVGLLGGTLAAIGTGPAALVVARAIGGTSFTRAFGYVGAAILGLVCVTVFAPGLEALESVLPAVLLPAVRLGLSVLVVGLLVVAITRLPTNRAILASLGGAVLVLGVVGWAAVVLPFDGVAVVGPGQQVRSVLFAGVVVPALPLFVGIPALSWHSGGGLDAVVRRAVLAWSATVAPILLLGYTFSLFVWSVGGADAPTHLAAVAAWTLVFLSSPAVAGGLGARLYARLRRGEDGRSAVA